MTRGSFPRVRNDTTLAASCLKASRGDAPNSERISERVEQPYQALATRHTFLAEPRAGLSRSMIVFMFTCIQFHKTKQATPSYAGYHKKRE